MYWTKEVHHRVKEIENGAQCFLPWCSLFVHTTMTTERKACSLPVRFWSVDRAFNEGIRCKRSYRKYQKVMSEVTLTGKCRWRRAFLALCTLKLRLYKSPRLTDPKPFNIITMAWVLLLYRRNGISWWISNRVYDFIRYLIFTNFYEGPMAK